MKQVLTKKIVLNKWQSAFATLVIGIIGAAFLMFGAITIIGLAKILYFVIHITF